MSVRFQVSFIVSVAVATILGWSDARPLSAQAPPPQQAPAENGDVEVLARGPVHEAFAEPVTLDRTDPLVVTKAPPALVEELPPEQRPEGANVEWIPGYWAWDDERTDFLWVSGVWRDVPPGQRWMPGYWSEKDRGWHWTAGFWVSEKAGELEYMPQPPESLDAGPQVAAPSPDHIWSPGVWRYRETRYVWQPGYWMVARPDWIWVPARYVWCPTGYVYCDGYWDYPLVRRGVLFAPVYYRAPVYAQVNYCYTPTVVIDPDILVVHLFARPRYCHYYFGDYYGPVYRDCGIYPWFSLHYHSYDPLFCYYNWHHGRHDRHWHHNVRRCHDYFEKHKEHRPAHTFAELRHQRRQHGHSGDAHIENAIAKQTDMAVTLDQYAGKDRPGTQRDGRRDGPRFARVSDDQRRNFAETGQQIRDVADRRGKIETAAIDQQDALRGERAGRRSLPMENLLGRSDERGRSGRTARDGGEASIEKQTTSPRERGGEIGRPGREQPVTSNAAVNPEAPALERDLTGTPSTTTPRAGRAGRDGWRGTRGESARQQPANVEPPATAIGSEVVASPGGESPRDLRLNRNREAPATTVVPLDTIKRNAIEPRSGFEGRRREHSPPNVGGSFAPSPIRGSNELRQTESRDNPAFDTGRSRFEVPSRAGTIREEHSLPGAGSRRDMTNRGTQSVPESSSFSGSQTPGAALDMRGRTGVDRGRATGRTMETMQPSYRPDSRVAAPPDALMQRSFSRQSDPRSFGRGSVTPEFRTESRGTISTGEMQQRFNRGGEARSLAPSGNPGISGGSGRPEIRSDTGRSENRRGHSRRGGD